MSIFNFRRGRAASPSKTSAKRPAAAQAPESVEVVRKRARQRLIGSAVLVLVGVVGFPLLFETQPRPVPVDIPIEIPSRQSVKPASPVPAVPPSASLGRAGAPDSVAAQAAEQSTTGAAAGAAVAVAAASAVSAQASLEAREEIVEPRSANAKPAEAKAAEAKASDPKPAETKPAPAAETVKAQATPATSATPPKPRAEDGQRAKALLEGAALSPTASASADTASRVVVQVGAFSDANKAREARAKLEKAGLKTYTQVTETKDGKRIRVRVGPYATKAEAEKAAAKIKSLDLPAAILVL